MYFYPFDNQLCHLQISIEKGQQDYVELVLKNVTYNGPRQMMQYVLDNYEPSFNVSRGIDW